MTNKPIISMEKVFKKYENNALALNDINVEIHKGEFVFIVGPSGAGKSTFMRMLLHEPCLHLEQLSSMDIISLK